MKRLNRNQRKKIRYFIVVAVLTAGFCWAEIMPVQAYEEITIVIDPGHGGEGEETHAHLGAVYHDLNEKDINLITAQAFYDELSQYGNLKVYLTRETDKAMTLKERVKFARSVRADYLIAVHYNASERHRFYGAEIFTSAFGEEYARGYSLAHHILNWWVEDGAYSKGVKTRIGKLGTDYYGLIREGREAGIPTIILEHGYLDNDVDFEKLSDEDAWRCMGVLDATAVADYFGVKKGVVAAEVKQELIVPIPEERVEPDQTPPEDVVLTIDAYDRESRTLSYTIKAKETESKLMYYDLDTAELAADLDLGFQHLQPWTGQEAYMRGTFQIPEGYRGGFVARVYNNYEQFTDTEVTLVPRPFLNADEVEDFGYPPPPKLHTETVRSEDATEQGEGGTWTIADGVKEFGTSDTEALKNAWKKYYFGMVAAAAVVIVMLVVSLILTVAAGAKRRRRRKRDRNAR